MKWVGEEGHYNLAFFAFIKPLNVRVNNYAFDIFCNNLPGNVYGSLSWNEKKEKTNKDIFLNNMNTGKYPFFGLED